MTLKRNQNSHFSKNPQVDVHRSTFTRDSSVKTTFNVGDLIPFYVDEVLPGDTFDIETSKLVRMQTLVAPIMDNIYLDTYFFFVPNRIVWNSWEMLQGDNPDSYWYTATDIQTPVTIAPDGGWNVGTLADYFGIPTGVGNLSVNNLPFRAYGKIWNDWFRDENTQAEQQLYDGSVATANTLKGLNDTSSAENWANSAVLGGTPLKAGKFRDYFTSCLPAPQKGPDVLVPLGDYAPVITQSDDNAPSLFSSGSPYSVRFKKYSTADGGSWVSGVGTLGLDSSSRLVGNNTTFSGSGTLVPTNLVANLQQATAASINALRLAFQMQKLYEKDARGGTRYIEILANHFGVTSPDSRLQRSEYLGGNRMLININQVIQSSATTDVSPQGNTTAYSLTVDSHHDFTKSFVEHGFVIGVMVARYNHSYQQGLDKFWLRRNRFDYYFPMFANIGEQPVKNVEIYAQGTSDDDKTFGYQEAWADYRYKPNKVTGEMRSQYAQSLDVWHLADYYESLPTLSSSWIEEDKAVVDRALAVTSDISAQLFGDFYIKNKTTRAMPLFSIPGLIDHH